VRRSLARNQREPCAFHVISASPLAFLLRPQPARTEKTTSPRASVEMMLGRSRPTFLQFLSKASFRFQAVQTCCGTSSAGASGDRESEPASVDAASRRDRVSCRSRLFLLALSAFWPLPLVNVIPGAIIVLIAIAYLQEDGLLLAVAAAAAFLSLEDFGWTLWRSGGAVMRWIGHSS
jgi:Exopolysaccharide synthesis, ExoD